MTEADHVLEWIGPDGTWPFVRAVLAAHFPDRSAAFLAEAFAQTETLFTGGYPKYQESDSAYHDLAHTLAATLATARLLDGHIKSKSPPTLGARDFELTIAGILLHDSGLIKQAGDNEGTGAKYTLTHVDRSADFAAMFLPPLGVSVDEIRVVQLAIRCTGVNADVSKLAFHDTRERFIGCALGTGDMLGQMAAPDYPRRLPALYREYAEAAAFSGLRKGGIASYTSPADLMRRSRQFYNDYVKRMLDTQWASVHKALEYHFPEGRNLYLGAIEANLKRIEELVSLEASI
jgi:hypothetical protein